MSSESADDSSDTEETTTDEEEEKDARQQAWLQKRSQDDMQYLALHESIRTSTLKELVRCFGMSNCLLGQKPLWHLIGEYTVICKDVWLAKQRLSNVLHIQHVAHFLSDIDENELVDLEKQISKIDPRDDSDDDRPCFNRKEDIRFVPEITKCEGCRKKTWTSVRLLGNGNDSFGLTRSIGQYRSHPDSGRSHWICNSCANFCYCASSPTKVSMYKQICSICFNHKCYLHDFQKQDRSTLFYKCDWCLQTFDRGRIFTAILDSPDPFAALAAHLKEIK